ncbi:MAG TPA: RNA polymerase sigma factor [Vicinamibacterales bacterium]|nr:RNA polymerase sigma factor [Vicinamibacterales bacterium]
MSTIGDAPLADDELVQHAIAGDREAFLSIYQRHHDGIFRFARAMTGSTATAEDVAQEVFLLFLRELQRFDPARGSLATYLFAIARNVCRHRLRKEQRFVSLDRPEDRASSGSDPVASMVAAETVTRVRLFIRALPSRYREVLILCDLQGLSYLEAARILNAPVGTVRSRLHRARQRLGERLAATGEHLQAGTKVTS